MLFIYLYTLFNEGKTQLWVSTTGFSKSVIYWGVKLFMALYVRRPCCILIVFGSQLISLNISTDGVLKSACNIIRAARFWSLDMLSRFDEEVVPHTTDP